LNKCGHTHKFRQCRSPRSGFIPLTTMTTDPASIRWRKPLTNGPVAGPLRYGAAPQW
jgi:hypothetical protein